MGGTVAWHVTQDTDTGYRISTSMELFSELKKKKQLCRRLAQAQRVIHLWTLLAWESVNTAAALDFRSKHKDHSWEARPDQKAATQPHGTGSPHKQREAPTP